MKSYLKRSCLFVSLLLVIAMTAFAVEPSPDAIDIFTRFDDNGGVFLVVENGLDSPVNLLLQPSLLGSVNFTPFALSLKSGESHETDISSFKFGQGLQALGVEAVLLDPNNRPLQGPRAQLFQPLNSDGNFFYAVSFEDAYLNNRNPIAGDSQPSNVDLGGGFIDKHGISPFSYSSHITPAGTTVQPVIAPNPLVMALMPLYQLPSGRQSKQPANGCVPEPPKKHHHDGDGKDDDDHDDRNGHNHCKAAGDDGDHHDHDKDHHDSDGHGSSSGSGSISGAASATPANDPLATGNLSLKYNDGTYHAAWGWVAIAWQQFFGVWIPSGSSYVDGAGNWSINFPQLPGVSKVYIEYRAANRFVQLQDSNGNIYAWGDSWDMNGPTVDVGSRFADLSANGDLPNVDKLYAGATNVWVKFYNNGMNALRDSAHRNQFPQYAGFGALHTNDRFER